MFDAINQDRGTVSVTVSLFIREEIQLLFNKSFPHAKRLFLRSENKMIKKAEPESIYLFCENIFLYVFF